MTPQGTEKMNEHMNAVTMSKALSLNAKDAVRILPHIALNPCFSGFICSSFLTVSPSSRHQYVSKWVSCFQVM